MRKEKSCKLSNFSYCRDVQGVKALRRGSGSAVVCFLSSLPSPLLRLLSRASQSSQSTIFSFWRKSSRSSYAVLSYAAKLPLQVVGKGGSHVQSCEPGRPALGLERWDGMTLAQSEGPVLCQG